MSLFESVRQTFTIYVLRCRIDRMVVVVASEAVCIFEIADLGVPQLKQVRDNLPGTRSIAFFNESNDLA